MKLPYDIIVIEAFKLIDDAVISYDSDLSKYLDYIEACGWTNLEFDLETLKRIDCNW